jgi:ribosome biogenesis GTPase
VSQERIVAAFGDLGQFSGDCSRGCSHQPDAPECGLDAAVARGELSTARLESFRRMISSHQ